MSSEQHPSQVDNIVPADISSNNNNVDNSVPPSSNIIPTYQDLHNINNKFDMRLDEVTQLMYQVLGALEQKNNTSVSFQEPFIPQSTNNDQNVNNNTIYQNRKSTPYYGSNSSTTSTTSTSNNTNNSRPYNGLFKLNSPPPFLGKTGTNATQVLSYISAMDRYIDAILISRESPESLVVSLQSLRDNALLWYENLARAQPLLIKCWNDLRTQILKRYQPIAQEQLSLSELLRIKYKTSIQQYNDEFTGHLQLLPSYNNPANEQLMMGIYMNGLTAVKGTTYICTVLNNAIHEKKETLTLYELQSIALLAQSNLGSNNRNIANTNVPFTSSYSSNNSRNNYNSRPSSGYSGNNNNYGRTGNSFHRTPFKPSIPSSSYNTPAKLNNIESDNTSDSGDPYDELANNDEDNGDDNDETISPVIHEEPSLDTEELFLANIQFYDKIKQSVPSLTPEKLAERRKLNTCFRCNRTGHFIAKCPLQKSSKNL